jgi:alginate O-acetyltransferase complex protein AlgI
MLFNSLIFLYGFLPITYLVFWRLKTKNARYVWLTVTGYVFYGWWDYRFCGLMLFSTVVSYFAGRALLSQKSPGIRRALLIVPVAVDLLLLGFFKYATFAIDSVISVISWFGEPLHHSKFSIILPIGISFYTFHTITYIVDSYRRTITPTRNFFEFSCYVSLFSQLVAGPIVRFREIEEDLEKIDKSDRRLTLDIGCSFFAIGLFKKLLIADTIAASIDPALLKYHDLSTVGAWLCALGYTYQLYFDFSGYSDMAVGLGYMFGIRIPQNFNSPYVATDPSDFWRRWHISLSSCLRDYLYIPLGGSRGSNLFTNRNLMLTMLIGGLWHGANWTFVIWGAYHGALLVLYRTFNHPWDRLPIVLRRWVTFALVILGWVLFRSTSFEMAGIWLGKMFKPAGGLLPLALPGLAGAIVVAAAFAHFGPNSFQMTHKWRRWQVVGIALLFLVCLGLLYGSKQSPFLYFQF